MQLKAVIQRGAYEDNLVVQALKDQVDAAEKHINDNTLSTLSDGELQKYIDDVRKSVKYRKKVDAELGDKKHEPRTIEEEGFVTNLEAEKAKREKAAAEKANADSAAKAQSQAAANGVVGTPGFTPGKGWNKPS